MAYWNFLVLLALQIVLVSRSDAAPGPLKTSGGNCTFPFTYKGVAYESCTTKNHDRPWCSTTANYEGEWKNCEGFAKSGVDTLEGESCAFPFTYRGKVYHSCIPGMRWHEDHPWCSTTVNFDKDGKGGDCAVPEPKRTTSGRNCTFPFTYKGVVYKTCTTKNHDRPWCSTTASYSGEWGDCEGFAESNEYTVKGESCVIPFTYRGTVYHSCITKWHTRPWCSTTVSYDKDKKWGDCADFEPSGLRTSEIDFCAIPFIHNGEKYTGCVTDGNRSPWCSLTANYDKDSKRGNCTGFFIDTSKTTRGQNCAFPFIYKGQHYNFCTKRNHDRYWCSTTTNYDEDKKWGDCKTK